MKKAMSTVFSVIMISMGLLIVVWAASSMVGRAHSQQPPAAAQPSKPSAPTMNLPPSEEMPPPEDTPALGAAPSQTEGIIPGFQNPEGYTYDPSGRRDPFRPFGQSQITAKIPIPIKIPTSGTPVPAAPSSPVLAEPLQQFDLAQLKVVGIVWEVRNPKAMIQDPLKKLHLVQKESKIGRNNGFVAAIREGEVIVVEPTVGEGGLQTASTRVMILVR